MALTALIPLLVFALIVIFVSAFARSLIRNHPMFAMLENKVSEFKKRAFASEEEKNRAKEEFKAELTTWKGTMELKKQEILWRNKVFGGFLVKKNIEMIDNMKKKLQEEIDSLN